MKDNEVVAKLLQMIEDHCDKMKVNLKHAVIEALGNKAPEKPYDRSADEGSDWMID